MKLLSRIDVIVSGNLIQDYLLNDLIFFQTEKNPFLFCHSASSAH